MAHPRRTLLAALAALAVLGGAGCAGAPPVAAPPPVSAPAPAPAPAPETADPAPAPAAGPDLRQLLIDPGDIAVTGFLEPTVQPLAEDAVTGLVATFDTEDGERQLGTTIVLLPDAAAAQEATAGAVSSTGEQRTGARSTPAPVGDHAVIFTGYELAGTASTLLLFSQGTASVAMDFRSPSTDPIPTAAVIETGTRQAARLRPAFG
jgi:hypothetical protein